MSLGILHTRGKGLRGALGYTSIIPANCWSQSGFNDCHAKAYAAAQASCAKSGMPDDTGCIDPTADSITMQTCKCSATTTTKPKATVVSTSVKPGAATALEPAEAGLFGMDQKTLLMVGLVGVGLYFFIGQKPKKGQ